MRRILGLSAFIVLSSLFAMPPAGADPYCGPGFFYEYDHRICSPSAPKPPPVFRGPDWQNPSSQAPLVNGVSAWILR